jgi:hypothetical protein
MEIIQINSQGFPIHFRFRLDPSLPWRFHGSDRTASILPNPFPEGQNGEMNKTIHVDTLHEPNGNPGTWTQEVPPLP